MLVLNTVQSYVMSRTCDFRLLTYLQCSKCHQGSPRTRRSFPRCPSRPRTLLRHLDLDSSVSIPQPRDSLQSSCTVRLPCRLDQRLLCWPDHHSTSGQASIPILQRSSLAIGIWSRGLSGTLVESSYRSWMAFCFGRRCVSSCVFVLDVGCRCGCVWKLRGMYHLSL